MEDNEILRARRIIISPADVIEQIDHQRRATEDLFIEMLGGFAGAFAIGGIMAYAFPWWFFSR